MRVDLNYHPKLRGATLVETKAFSNQATKTNELLFCFDTREVLFIRSSAELKDAVILCENIYELQIKMGDVDHVCQWYKEWEEREGK
jgi:hypothetical protein